MECSDTVGKSLAQNLCKKLEHFADAKSIPSNLIFSMDHALAEYLQNLVDHSDVTYESSNGWNTAVFIKNTRSS